jgi:hypothetical protein
MFTNQTPDEVALRSDLNSVAFESQVGLRWGEPRIEWPYLYLWVAARKTSSGPDHYWLRVDCSGYPQKAPTGTFWDIDRDLQLSNDQRPGGAGEVALAFRIDWPGPEQTDKGSAFYILCDRIAISTHPDWTEQKYPKSIWTPKKDIGHYLDEITRLLDSEEYTGLRGPQA